MTAAHQDSELFLCFLVHPNEDSVTDPPCMRSTAFYVGSVSNHALTASPLGTLKNSTPHLSKTPLCKDAFLLQGVDVGERIFKWQS